MSVLPPFSRGVEPVGRLQILLFNRSGLLFERFFVPGNIVEALPEVLKEAQAVNPAVDVQAVFRTALRLGLRAVARMSERGVPIRPGDVPPLRASHDGDDELKRRSSMPQDVISGLAPSRT